MKAIENTVPFPRVGMKIRYRNGDVAEFKNIVDCPFKGACPYKQDHHDCLDYKVQRINTTSTVVQGWPCLIKDWKV